jgi:pyrroline-5-carboxylate reductase
MPVQNYPPQELIQKVASKGGTTEAALQYLRQHKTDLTFQEALRRAYRRAQDLSK